MALLFCDSFDDRDIDHVYDRYSGARLDQNAGACMGTGRTGQGLYLSTGILDVNDYVDRYVPAGQTLIVGVARNAHVSTSLCSIRYNGIPHIYANVGDDGRIWVYRFDDPVEVLATSTQTVPTTGWYYVELKGTIDPTNGSYELRVDGHRWLADSGLNTSSSGGSIANQVRLIYNHPAVDGWITGVDDFYIANDDDDGGDAVIADFAGPVHIAALFASGAGDVNDWVPNGADTSAHCVDETTGEDGDTTYASSMTQDAMELYALDNLAIVRGAIRSVAVHQWAKKEDALYRALRPTARVNGVDYQKALSGLAAAYTRNQSIWERNPATAMPWTIDEVNALQAGVQLDISGMGG